MTQIVHNSFGGCQFHSHSSSKQSYQQASRLRNVQHQKYHHHHQAQQAPQKMAHLLFSLQHSSSRLTDYELIPCREEHECISRRGLHITHSDIPMHICFTEVCYVPWLHLKAGCWLARLYKNLSCLLQEGSYHIMKEKLGTCHESFLPSSLLDYFCYQKIHISTTRNSWEAQHTNADEIVLANFVRISKECASLFSSLDDEKSIQSVL